MKSSPYMLLVAEIKKEMQISMTLEQEKLFGIEKLNIKRSKIPAVTMLIIQQEFKQFIKETNPRYYKLIKNLKKLRYVQF